MTRRLIVLVLALLGLALVLPAAVFAADATQSGLAFSGDQVGALLAGFLTPLVIYPINHYLPFVNSEQAKVVIHVAIAAFVGAAYQALFVSHMDFATWTTWEFMVTAVVGALGLGHKLTYVTGGINVLLGGGSNAKR